MEVGAREMPNSIFMNRAGGGQEVCGLGGWFGVGQVVWCGGGAVMVAMFWRGGEEEVKR